MNKLALESSPYLLQHARNPVNWIAWSDDIFSLAKKENKLILISIGYSACHWCHVMEHECFEDETVAAYMNEHFINIKVDREERPDIDQVYMSALQLMTQKGGWPLNCFCLSDGRPIYGGTYFPKDSWMNVMAALIKTQNTDFPRMLDFAAQLQEGIHNSELITQAISPKQLSEEKLNHTVQSWVKVFDKYEGGNSRAPKFPMPNNYLFLLNYSHLFNNKLVTNHVRLTLNKMEQGGIFDQIGGGFSRYSVDVLWKVPHFEKMLYDNAQLIELYATAFNLYGELSYKQVVEKTFEWLMREMRSETGGFYSALDADSEREEGRFYCWNITELKSVLESDFDWVKNYYSINSDGFWEDDKYILLKRKSDPNFAIEMNWTIPELNAKTAEINKKLLFHRQKRIAPGLDNKCLTSWNGLLISALCQAYNSFNNTIYLATAEQTGEWLLNSQMDKKNRLFHNFTLGKANIPGFLEDYACCIDAFIKLYQTTKNIKWVLSAEKLTKTVEKEFMHPESKMCYFTSSDNQLIARKMELHDNVMPSSNSVMAKNFWMMGQYFQNENWINYARQMLANATEEMENYGSGHSNWAILYLMELKGPIEITCLDSLSFNLNHHAIYPRERVILNYHSDIPMGSNHTENGIYICANETCLPPITLEENYLAQINSL
jgi:uncharacterized protein YyaL (SSP411 family)